MTHNMLWKLLAGQELITTEVTHVCFDELALSHLRSFASQ